MFSEEKINEWIEDCKGKSGLEAPILGTISTPVCKVCKKSDYHYGTWKEPECSVLGDIPEDLALCHSYDCKFFERDCHSCFNKMFTFDENGKPSPKP